jgi:hypothetical protein
MQTLLQLLFKGFFLGCGDFAGASVYRAQLLKLEKVEELATLVTRIPN